MRDLGNGFKNYRLGIASTAVCQKWQAAVFAMES